MTAPLLDPLALNIGAVALEVAVALSVVVDPALTLDRSGGDGLDNALSVGFPQLLEESGAFHLYRFAGIGNEGVLDDDAGDAVLAGIPDNRIIVGDAPVAVLRPVGRILRFHPAVLQAEGGELGHHPLAQIVSGLMGVVVVAAVVGNPHLAPLRCRCGGIDVNAHENRGLGGYGLLHALGKAHVHVGRARHEHVDAVPLKRRLAVLRNGEVDVLLFEPVVIVNRTRVAAAVARIEGHHDVGGDAGSHRQPGDDPLLESVLDRALGLNVGLQLSAVVKGQGGHLAGAICGPLNLKDVGVGREVLVKLRVAALDCIGEARNLIFARLEVLQLEEGGVAVHGRRGNLMVARQGEIAQHGAGEANLLIGERHDDVLGRPGHRRLLVDVDESQQGLLNLLVLRLAGKHRCALRLPLGGIVGDTGGIGGDVGRGIRESIGPPIPRLGRSERSVSGGPRRLLGGLFRAHLVLADSLHLIFKGPLLRRLHPSRRLVLGRQPLLRRRRIRRDLGESHCGHRRKAQENRQGHSRCLAKIGRSHYIKHALAPTANDVTLSSVNYRLT